jgi:hypothetical protein
VQRCRQLGSEEPLQLSAREAGRTFSLSLSLRELEQLKRKKAEVAIKSTCKKMKSPLEIEAIQSRDSVFDCSIVLHFCFLYF